MEIRKMRGNEISVGEVPFIIVPNDTIVINKPESIEGMPSATNPESVIKLKFKYSDYKIDFPKGSQTLFVVHPSIDPLIISSALGTNIILSEKFKVIYRSYLHGEKTIKDRFEICAKNLFSNSKEIMNLINTVAINPTKYSVDQLYYLVNRLEEQVKADIVVVEGLETLYDLTSRESFINSQYNNMIKRMVNGITSFYFTRGTKENLLEIPLINFYDNVINIEPVITSEGRFVKIEPLRIVMKAAPFFEILVNADYMEKCTNM
jgi:circadian clock protein KaiC